MQNSGRNSNDGFAGLTEKQRQVLDLLIQYKTSKEIGRELRISPHTVDQRIQFAKEKLGAATRSEAAIAYRELIEMYERTTYDDSGIAAAPSQADGANRAKGPIPESSPDGRVQSNSSKGTEPDHPVVVELFEGRFGTLVRLVAIVGIAVLLVFLVLGGLAMLSQLSQLLAH